MPQKMAKQPTYRPSHTIRGKKRDQKTFSVGVLCLQSLFKRRPPTMSIEKPLVTLHLIRPPV